MLHANAFPTPLYQYPMAQEHLAIIDRTLRLALNHSKRVCVLRFDLRFPQSELFRDPKVISRFIDSFKAHLKQWDRQRASEHPIAFGYVWCREQDSAQNRHYHLMFVFNKDAVCRFGKNEFGNGNIYNRILCAWASAICIPAEEAIGLVHICKNGVYWLNQNSSEFSQQYQAVMARCSYLAKLATKDINDGYRNMGSSQQLFMA
ncbi:inovirus Gp2 family protein [Shewanella algae]|uniref:inovirus Gp2 family protein n=1 Tax=Shewanella algae TaxID=38313 RepID=UPI0030058855